MIEHVLAVDGVQVTRIGEPEDGVSGEALLVRDVLAVVAWLSGRRCGRSWAKTGRVTAVLRQEWGAG